MRIEDKLLPAGDGRKPFRLWMTGSLAVVMASLCTGRGVLDDERLASTMRVVRHSPFGVTETVLRIEQAARQRGQEVLAKIGSNELVLVLASSVGGTPVLMTSPDAVPDVPLTVQVRRNADGGADVLMARVGDAGLAALPDTVAAELLALPGLVDRALS
ncbi:MAG: hypothetical protein KIT35_11785 [Piscinibacter sp.]|uniref:hypothetical protein n=1 Tax=Piscinibacter TaxID=1114981 RepID=UPI000FDF27F2|nr:MULTISPECIES: hypothetical protein [Piscinibacter]MCW5664507.1 hypothetical protein [Piscinibacter sp.]